jgi:hypothetical protein
LRQGYAALMPRNPMAWGRVCFAPGPRASPPIGVAVYPVICRRGAYV